MATVFDPINPRPELAEDGTLDCRPFVPNTDLRDFQTPFVTDRYRVEYDCEATRLLKHAEAPSRLSALLGTATAAG